MTGEKHTTKAFNEFDKCLASNLVIDDCIHRCREKEPEKKRKSPPLVDFQGCFSGRTKSKQAKTRIKTGKLTQKFTLIEEICVYVLFMQIDVFLRNIYI